MATKSLMPEHFHGVSSEDSERWWNDIEHWCMFRQFNEVERVSLIPLLLKDGARLWFDRLTEARKDTFIHIKESFLDYFKRGDEIRWKDMAEVWATVQLSKQTVEDYIINIQ